MFYCNPYLNLTNNSVFKVTYLSIFCIGISTFSHDESFTALAKWSWEQIIITTIKGYNNKKFTECFQRLKVHYNLIKEKHAMHKYPYI